MTRTDKQVGIVCLLLSVLALSLYHTGRRLSRVVIEMRPGAWLD